jgi:hypothetical protein
MTARAAINGKGGLRYRTALEEVKAFVCGEAVSKWGIDPQTTKSRIRIANTCDVALLNLPKVISPEQERACLMTNPYEGDFGDGEVLLKDKMGNARKPHTCTQCQEGISPGDRVRMRTEAYEGKVMTFYFCTACCLAFAVSHLDDGRAWESRITLGRSTESTTQA